MPSALTYPGVYIEEIPSGVRTITGVSTSVTAFVGSARRGPINRAVRILGFADFERRFGRLRGDSELGYAVRQFFQNGGSQAWVIRIAKNAQAATATLVNAAPANVLDLTALDEGKAGNFIRVAVDYATATPGSTFNLVLTYVDPDDASQSRLERFTDLSMNSADPRYVEGVVADGSQLVKADRVDAAVASINAVKGQSISAALVDSGGTALDVVNLVDATHNQFQVVVAGGEPVTVTINPATDLTGANVAARLASLCSAIQTRVGAVLGAGKLNCTSAGNTIVLEDNTPGERSSVRVLAGLRNDVSGRLKLGSGNGGREVDAVAALRPAQMPDPGRLDSGTLAGGDFPTLTPDAAHNSLRVGLDGYGPDLVTLDLAPPPVVADTLAVKLDAFAANIQAKVRALKAANPAYSGFTVTRGTSPARLVLSSGTRGAGSQVYVEPASTLDIAAALKLSGGGATATPGIDRTLLGGNESDYTDADVYNLIIADRSTRKGLYALEGVDGFNLLCLPGVSDPGVLADADAYCRERRAFMIVDSPSSVTTVDAIVQTAGGTALPKTRNAAVYFPWISIADPLQGGKLRRTPPSGTIAGLYARTDGSRGVWKAPAGTEASLVGVQAVDHVLTDPENGVINPLGVNAIRLLPGVGSVAWGARTLRGSDLLADEYKYIPIRRLALFIEESLFRGTQWVVFEPNDEPLWAQIRLNVGAFMHNLFRQGAFQGKTPKEAYLVLCDSQTTTQNDRDLGVVNVLIGFAPLKPAEFVVIQIQQMAGQVEA